MRRRDGNRWMVEAWAFLAVAVIAFVGGLLIGNLGSSPKTEIVHVSATEGEETEAVEPSGAAGAGGEESGGSQIFTSTGCGSCHTLAAAGSTGTTGPDLNEFLAPDDTTAGVEEMILHPNLELAEGYPANVMPQNYGQTLSKPEVQELAEYLVANTPAKP
jgi:mono/diheme cytochrome c family protein